MSASPGKRRCKRRGAAVWLCRAALAAVLMGACGQARATIWNSAPVDGWYTPSKSGVSLSSAGVTAYVQTDNNDALSGKCFAQITTNNAISGKRWFDVYFNSSLPPLAAVTSAKVYVQYQGSNTQSGTLVIHISTNRASTMWYAGLLSDSDANSGDLSWNSTEQTYTYDVTSVLDTPEKINNCEVLVLNKSTSTDKLYFDYILLEVEYSDQAAPAMGNGSGASNVQTNTARLNGEVLAGAPAPQVFVYWGDNDGGTVATNWDFAVDKGTLPAGGFSQDMSGLTANKTYYYRCYGTNSFGSDWANSTASFTTLPPSVQFSIASSNGDELVSAVVIPVALSQVSAANASINYSVTGGTASNGADFTLSGGSVTIPAGNTTTNARITINEDTLDEDNETIVVTLSSPSGATLGVNSSHTYTIQDNDAPPSVMFSGMPYNVLENATNIAITVVLGAASGRGVSVNYQTVQGTAVGNLDYTNVSGTLAWSPGETVKSFTVPIVNDVSAEGTETFTNILSGAVNCAISGTGQEPVSILDDEQGRPAVNNYEGASNVTGSSATMRGLIAGTGGAPTQVWIYWGTSDGVSNKASWTYNKAMGILPQGLFFTNLVGLASHVKYYYRCYASNVNGDAWADSTTNFLTGPPVVQFALATSSAPESVSPLVIDLRLSAPETYGLPVTVSYSATGGSAANGTDYTLASGNATIPAGSNSTSIVVTISNDTTDEYDETFVVSISNAVNATIGATNAHTCTIFDDDSAPTVWCSNTPYSVKESGTNITIYVALSQASAKTVSVNYATSDGSAVAGVAYSNTSGSFLWTPGIGTAKMFKVSIIDNALQEGNKTFYAVLSSTQNCAIAGDPATLVTIVEDDIQLPTVTNDGGATNILWASATLRGNAIFVYPLASVSVFWGASDGGMVSNSWQNRIELGALSGDFSADIAGLVAGRTYYYRCYVTNSAGYDWADSTASFSTPVPQVAGGTNYYVNDADTSGDVYCLAPGNSTNSALNRASPAISIQAVLNAFNLQPGDCVWIDTGYYGLSATITITNQDFGANGTSVVFRGSTSAQGSVLDRGNLSANVVFIDVPSGGGYVRLESLKLRGGRNGVYATGSYGNYASGIEVVGCSPFENAIGGEGIYLRYCTAPVVSDNVCYSNGYDGIYLQYCPDAVISGNECHRQQNAESYGAWITFSSGAVVSSNICHSNRQCGICVQGGSASIIGNVCYSNGYQGLKVSAPGCSAQNNISWGNSRSGIWGNAADLEFSGNTAHDNVTCGIYSDVPTDHRYRNNLIYDNGDYGIYVDGYDNKVTIENNTIHGPGGVFLFDPQYVTNRNNVLWATGVSNAAVKLAEPMLFRSDYNDMYATDGAVAGDWSGVPCGLALWRSVSGGDSNSISSDPLFVDAATGNYHLQSKAGSRHGGAWQADPVNSPCIDAADPWAVFTNEPDYNGLTRNQGAYGNTAEASKTYYTGAFRTVSLQVVPPQAGSAGIWPPTTNWLYPTNRLITVWETVTNANYAWGHWAGGISGTETQKSFRASTSTTVQAVFDTVLYSITATAGPGGSISPTGVVIVVHGNQASFTVTPDAGAAITNVIVDSVPRGVTNGWTFLNVTNNHTIQALFASGVWNITATAGPGGNIAPSGTVVVANGSNVTFAITTNSGYAVSNVVVDSVSRGVTNSWTFLNVTNNHSISAFFSSLEQYTSHNTPYSWLALYGITNNQETADNTDLDSDKALTWQEYVARTVPTNPKSVFSMVRVAYSSGVSRLSISFSSVSGRTYTPQYASSPRTADWTNTQYSTTATGTLQSAPIPGTGTNVVIFTDPSGATNRTYRMKVTP